MIFNCPECNAGHSVPVSMIPNGGLDMDCRRCGEAFTIEPPPSGSKRDDESQDLEVSRDFHSDATEGDEEAQAETTNVGPPPVPESTKVGVANPLEFEGDRPLIGPGGIQYHEHSNAPFESEHTEEDTGPFDRIEDEKTPLDPAVTDPGEVQSVWSGEVSDAPSVVPEVPPMNSGVEASASESTPSVYERVAAGIPVPEEKERSASQSLRVRPVSRPSVFKPVVDILNRAPLALKVGLIVFPVTLGVMLVINSFSDGPEASDGPIEIPVAAEVQAAKVVDAPPPTSPPAELEPPPPPPVVFTAKPIDDPPAPDGFQYVQVDDARLRVKPTERAYAAGRVSIGALVKKYDAVGDWTLVASLPDGPAGFINTKLLGARKPIALLARDQAFERCETEEGGNVDECSFIAKQQEQACLDRCGAVNAGNEAERLRCAEICNIAFETCAKSCRDSAEPKLAKGKKKKR
jgi:hypothetical protein